MEQFWWAMLGNTLCLFLTNAVVSVVIGGHIEALVVGVFNAAWMSGGFVASCLLTRFFNRAIGLSVFVAFNAFWIALHVYSWLHGREGKLLAKLLLECWVTGLVFFLCLHWLIPALRLPMDDNAHQKIE